MTFLEQIKDVVSKRRKLLRGACLCCLYYFEIPICVMNRDEKIEAALREKFGDAFPKGLQCNQVGGMLKLYIPFPENEHKVPQRQPLSQRAGSTRRNRAPKTKD